MIHLIFPPAENGPFLLVEATFCCRFYDGRQAEDERTKIIVQSAHTSAIEQSAIVMNGRDFDVSMHDSIWVFTVCCRVTAF